MNEDFINLYLGEFVSAIDKRIYDLAERYHEICEAYDRTVCTGPIRNGSIMPNNGHELVLINKHARSVMKELSTRVLCLGFTSDDLLEAIRHHD